MRKKQAKQAAQRPKASRPPPPPCPPPPPPPHEPTRGNAGHFARGQSGNPAGRPKGSRNKAALLAASLIGNDCQAVIAKALELAKNGDRMMLRLVVDRILPKARTRSEVDLPELGESMGKAADIVSAMEAVIRSVAVGAMSLEEAQLFAAMLDVQRRAIETNDLQARIEALEATDEQPKKYGLR